MAHATMLRVLRPERLWETVEASGRIGAMEDGGLCRLALTADDAAARRQFIAWCEDAGCTVATDPIGNIFARRLGREPSLPAVAIGSHLDTQIAAGRYDGVVGVMAGLEIVRALGDAGVETRRSVDVVSWTNEEGARFSPPMMGSAVFSGALALEDALAATDADGTSVEEALAVTGFADGPEPIGARPLDSYFELHIEQGPALDAAGVDVGVVDGAFPVRAFVAVIRGETAHAGSTPMAMRRNAVTAAGNLIVAADMIGRAHGVDGRSTTTRIRVWPNLNGIVASEVDLAIDIRHSSAAELELMVRELEDAAAGAARAGRVAIELRPTYSFGGLTFDAGCVELIEQAAIEVGATHMRMQSQSGHDAYNLAAICATAMIFCPCRAGVTHNPAEDVDEARVWPSVETLMRVVLARAER